MTNNRLLPLVGKAHESLLATQTSKETQDAQVKELMAEENAADVEHDQSSRATHTVLTVAADIAETPTEADGYIDLRNKLFPNGLSIIIASRMDEAGDVELTEKRVTEADKALLASVPLPHGKSLLDMYNKRIAAGRKLGVILKKRTELEIALAQKEAVKQIDVSRARNGWIKVVNAFLAVLELEEMAQETRQRIMRQLNAAERKMRRTTTSPSDEATPSSDETSPSEEKQ